MCFGQVHSAGREDRHSVSTYRAPSSSTRDFGKTGHSSYMMVPLEIRVNLAQSPSLKISVLKIWGGQVCFDPRDDGDDGNGDDDSGDDEGVGMMMVVVMIVVMMVVVVMVVMMMMVVWL